ncbi:MAG: WecB/TagA/CpsF family glycosyltransferase [Caldilineaceae bacterium]|nr:WecB/TagA/CpsF family glycosyltransferase [Caldilineaceae bacterium]
MNLPSTITILDIPIHNLTYEQTFARIEEMIRAGAPNQVTTVNPEFLVMARQDASFRRVLQVADLVLADGVGLHLGAMLQGKRFVSRVAGSQLVYRLAPLAAQQGWRLFFLGAETGVAEDAAQRLRAQYPGIDITVNAADPTPEGTAAALDHIHRARPDILLVAYGAPKQDLWIARNKENAAVPVMIGIGGTLDVIAGRTPRPPQWLHDIGLEWLFRLWKQPSRWRRQLRLPVFVVLIIAQRLGMLRPRGA